jgi:hypothetical protein
MKNSAAGEDEVTIGMILNSGETVVGRICDLLIDLWGTSASEWPTMIRRAVVFSLWKKKGDRKSLDNHRGATLICLYIRVIARVVASRLRDYCGKQKILSNTQYGFRPGRSTLGVVFVMRRLIGFSSRAQSKAVTGPLTSKRHTRRRREKVQM